MRTSREALITSGTCTVSETCAASSSLLQTSTPSIFSEKGEYFGTSSRTKQKDPKKQFPNVERQRVVNYIYSVRFWVSQSYLRSFTPARLPTKERWYATSAATIGRIPVLVWMQITCWSRKNTCETQQFLWLSHGIFLSILVMSLHRNGQDKELLADQTAFCSVYLLSMAPVIVFASF